MPLFVPQTEHDRFKAESEKRMAAASAELSTLQSQVEALERGAAEARAAEREYAGECQRIEQEAEAEKARLEVRKTINSTL